MSVAVATTTLAAPVSVELWGQTLTYYNFRKIVICKGLTPIPGLLVKGLPVSAPVAPEAPGHAHPTGVGMAPPIFGSGWTGAWAGRHLDFPV